MKATQKIAFCLLLLLSFTIYAQDKFNCDAALATFEANVEAGDLQAAQGDLAALRKHCRGFNEKVYTYGETIFLNALSSVRDNSAKGQLINDLGALYAEYDKYYPQSNASIKHAMLQYDNKQINEDEAYKLLDAAFNSRKTHFTDYNALEAYYLLYLKKYEGDKTKITPEQFVEKYGTLSGQVRYAAGKLTTERNAILKKQDSVGLSNSEKIFLNTSEANIESLSAVGENIDKLASKHLGCETLGTYYTDNYEGYKTDKGWLEAMVNSLLTNKCYKYPVLETGAKELHRLNPTSLSAFNLATIAQRKNELKQAAAYYEEAAQLEPNQKKKSELYYRIASVYRNNDMAAAKNFVLKAAQVNPSTGRPYIFLAEMYASASKDCGLSAFEQKALLYLSVETLNKAAVAEPKYKSTVASMVKQYSERLPTKADLSAAGKKKGDTITYGCWINETVTIPNIK